MQIPACMTVEQVETQDSAHGSLSPPGFDLEVTLFKDNTEELGALPKELGTDSKREAEKAYGVYHPTEKWFIVSMASLAAFFR